MFREEPTIVTFHTVRKTCHIAMFTGQIITDLIQLLIIPVRPAQVLTLPTVVLHGDPLIEGNCLPHLQ